MPDISLSDFSTDDEEIINVEDFAIEQDSVTIKNIPSNRNMAAYLAVLKNGENPVEDYEEALLRVEGSNGELVNDEVVDGIKLEEVIKDEAMLVDILGDTTVDDSDKASLVNSWIEGAEKRSELTSLVAHKELSQINETASPESERVRIDTTRIIDRIIQYNQFKQQVLNAELSKYDGGILSVIADFAELIVPLADQTQKGLISRELKEFGGGNDLYGFAATLVMMGQSKEEMSKMLSRMPIDQRMLFISKIVELVNKHGGIVFSDSNELAKIDILRTILEDGYYTDFDQVVDNIISVLDATIIGGAIVRFIKTGTVVARVLHSSRVSKTLRDAVVSDVKPSTVSQVLKDTNPEKAAEVAKMASVSDEFSFATYGTSRTEAVARDNLSEIFDPIDEIVAAKGHRLDTQIVDDLDVDEVVASFVSQENGAIYYFDLQKNSMRIKEISKLKEAVGPTTRTEMFQVDTLDDGLRVRAVYGPAKSGYENPQEALNTVEYMFRERGVSRDDLILLQRVEEGYKPVTKNTIAPGDYLVGMDYRYKFAAHDGTAVSTADVKRNWLDFIPALTDGKHGTIQRMLLDAHSFLHPVLTLGANRAVDAGFGLERELQRLGKIFSKKFAGLSGARRNIVANHIYKANEQGIAHTYTILKAAGMTEDEIGIMGLWKKSWDTVYWLENLDFSRSLRNAGYMRFIDTASDSTMFARPVSKQKLPKRVVYYDTATGQARSISGKQLDELYDQGGTVAKLKDDLIIDSEAVEFIVSSERLGENYLRAIRDGDRVLNYRPGYYSVRYKDPKFIEKVYLDRNGIPIESSAKAVATAGNVKDADLIKSRLEISTPAEDRVIFRVRGDIKKDGFNSNYGLANTQGRMATKKRGERLEDASGPMTDPSMTHIQDPVEALSNSIRSISKRVSMRDYLEATKVRFLRQYADVLSKDKFGNPAMPTDLRDIGQVGKKIGSLKNRQVADARSTYEYIQYLENGYIDAIDDGIKALFHTMADTLGEIGLVKLEKAARVVADISPNKGIRTTAFNMYLALNPLRQLMVQSHQAVRLLAINPLYMSNPRGMAAEMSVLINAFLTEGKVSPGILKAAGMTISEAQIMAKQFRNSGLAAAVDANNIVRSSQARLADTTYWHKLKTATGFLPKAMQRVGFDIGEMTNVATAWLSFRNVALKKSGGKALSPAQLDMIVAEARNFTYNMNAAGDMPYNQNMLSSLFQFMQVPHKALLNNITNRAIAPSVRIKTAVFDIAIWGVPFGLGTYLFQTLNIEDEGLRNVVNNGVEDVILNKLASLMLGEETDIDFSSLAPGDLYGMSEVVLSMLTSPITEIVANSPGGQLFFGFNPRVTNAVKDGLRFLGILVDGNEDVATLKQTAESFARMASGLSNTFKYLYAKEYGQMINSRGQTVDEDINAAEALAQLFGLPTKTATRLREVSSDLYLKSKEHDDDVKAWIKDRIRIMVSSGYSKEEMLSLATRDGEVWRVWGDANNRAKQIIVRELKKITPDKKLVLLKNLTKALGFMTYEDFKEFVLNSPFDEEQKKILLQFNEDVKNQKDEED